MKNRSCNDIKSYKELTYSSLYTKNICMVSFKFHDLSNTLEYDKHHSSRKYDKP